MGLCITNNINKMEILKSVIPVDQRRMKIMLSVMAVNFILFGIGIFKGVDFSDMGAGLALVNTPVMSWIVGESIRPTLDPQVKKIVQTDEPK
jgi:uncharacterized membrane protein YkgB